MEIIRISGERVLMQVEIRRISAEERVLIQVGNRMISGERVLYLSGYKKDI